MRVFLWKIFFLSGIGFEPGNKNQEARQVAQLSAAEDECLEQKRDVCLSSVNSRTLLRTLNGIEASASPIMHVIENVYIDRNLREQPGYHHK